MGVVTKYLGSIEHDTLSEKCESVLVCVVERASLAGDRGKVCKLRPAADSTHQAASRSRRHVEQTAVLQRPDRIATPFRPPSPGNTSTKIPSPGPSSAR